MKEGARGTFSLHLDDTRKGIEVLALVVGGNIAAAAAKAQEYAQSMGDWLGALRYEMPTAQVVVITPPLKAFETRVVLNGVPGTVYSMQAEADGGFSVEVSGSPWVKFAAGAQGAFEPARQSEGAGSASPVHVDKGEWCNWTYDAVNGGQTMRPQLL